MLLGVMLFFDGALLALGNVRRSQTEHRQVLLTDSCVQILFLSGITLIIGPQKTFYFFARKQKIRGTVCFLGGILLVFFKWPFIGMIVETFGFLNLFGCVIYDIGRNVWHSRFAQRLLPSYHHILTPTTIHWQRPLVAIHSKRLFTCLETVLITTLTVLEFYVTGCRPISRFQDIGCLDYPSTSMHIFSDL